MRDIRINLPTRRRRLIALGLALGVFAWAAVGIMRECEATKALASEEPSVLERASRLVPDDAAYPHHLGHWEELSLLDGNTQRALGHYRRATELNPYEAEYWLDLANALETEGQSAEAETAVNRAAQADPRGSRTLWRVGNFWLRTDHPSRALPYFHQALLANPDLARPVIEASHRTFADTELICREVFPPEPRYFHLYLWYLQAGKETDAAFRVWDALLALSQPFDRRAALGFVDYLIDVRRLDLAQRAWGDLERLQMVPKTERDPQELLRNADLSTPVLDGGFDWRVISHPHVRAALGAGRGASKLPALVLEFSGEDNLDCRCFHQFVLVQPNTAFRFEAWVKTEGITTESGPRLAVADAYSAEPPPAYSPSLVGTSDWQLLTVNFKSGPQTRLVRVALVRLPSARLHGRFAGTVRATEFSFRAASAAW